MPTLILSPRFSADSIALWQAAVSAGWDVERLQRFDCPPELADRDPVFYGETLLADAISEPLGLALLQPTYAWLPELPERFRRRDVRLTTLAEARGLTARTFVKSVDEKWFQARVYEDGAELGLEHLAPDLEVLIAEPVVFGLEVRLFVCDRRVLAHSPYIRSGQLAETNGEWTLAAEERDAALDFARTVLEATEVQLPRAVVLDVGEIEGRGWAVVEANAAWASGVCGADPARVLEVLRAACVKKTDLTEADAPWVRARSSMVIER